MTIGVIWLTRAHIRMLALLHRQASDGVRAARDDLRALEQQERARQLTAVLVVLAALGAVLRAMSVAADRGAMLDDVLAEQRVRGDGGRRRVA